VKPHEFRLNGRFYDVVHKQKVKGIWHYQCINDIQETKLFERLSSATAVNLKSTPPGHPIHSWLKLFQEPLMMLEHNTIIDLKFVPTQMEQAIFTQYSFYKAPSIGNLERPPICV
jgi:hypothetical protein